jgi:acyl carrier protein
MGIDFLDIHFRLERQFKIKIGNELVRVAESRGIKDLRVRDIVEFLQARVPPIDLRSGPSVDRPCVLCKYNLRGLPVFGNCPECGTVASHYGQIQARVYQTLVAALGVQPEEIHLDALLIRDLGMG